MKTKSRREFLRSGILSSLFLSTSAALGPLFANDKGFLTPRYKPYKRSSGSLDWKRVRELFPINPDLHHFNVAGLGPTSLPVLEAMSGIQEELAFNGRDGRWHYKQAREKLAEFVDADEDSISFTRNTTEGMNIAAQMIPFEEGDEVILTDQDHIGGAAPFVALQKQKGVKIKLAKLNPNGENLLEDILAQITPKTKAISVCHVCCTNGMILPVKEIVETCKKKNIFSIVDGAQAVGMLPLHLDELGADFYAASGHKWLYGPIGTGFLYSSQKVLETLDPPLVGAYSDRSFDLDSAAITYLTEASRNEYGTRNPANVVGLANAITLINQLELKAIQIRAKGLRDAFLDFLKDLGQIEILSPVERAHPAMLSFRSKEHDSKELVESLRSQKRVRLRHVYEGNLDAVRVSIPIYASDEDFNLLLLALKEMLKR